VPQAYWGRHWGYGEFLPSFFWRNQVIDWWDYDLPPPPYGCAWVWINGGVALIDLSDGYILEVQYDIW
jgi:Ni/Co efflux regulator RcnB